MQEGKVHSWIGGSVVLPWMITNPWSCPTTRSEINEMGVKYRSLMTTGLIEDHIHSEEERAVLEESKIRKLLARRSAEEVRCLKQREQRNRKLYLGQQVKTCKGHLQNAVGQPGGVEAGKETYWSCSLWQGVDQKKMDRERRKKKTSLFQFFMILFVSNLSLLSLYYYFSLQDPCTLRQYNYISVIFCYSFFFPFLFIVLICKFCSAPTLPLKIIIKRESCRVIESPNLSFYHWDLLIVSSTKMAFAFHYAFVSILGHIVTYFLNVFSIFCHISRLSYRLHLEYYDAFC